MPFVPNSEQLLAIEAVVKEGVLNRKSYSFYHQVQKAVELKIPLPWLMAMADQQIIITQQQMTPYSNAIAPTPHTNNLNTYNRTEMVQLLNNDERLLRTRFKEEKVIMKVSPINNMADIKAIRSPVCNNPYTDVQRYHEWTYGNNNPGTLRQFVEKFGKLPSTCRTDFPELNRENKIEIAKAMLTKYKHLPLNGSEADLYGLFD